MGMIVFLFNNRFMNFAAHELIVLKENKFGYEPDADEIVQYGQHLGLSFPDDERFTPMLYEALKASLPENWEACQVKGDPDTIVYRNKNTNRVQADHPVDAIYRDKIFKIKAMTADLAIEVIAEETQSWLRESSDMLRNSKLSADQIKRNSDHQFVENISEEQSFYEAELTSQGQSSTSRRNQKPINSARTYRKKEKKERKVKIPKQVIKEETFQEKLSLLKQNLSTYWPQESISLSKISKKQISALKTQEQINEYESIMLILKQIQQKKHQLARLKLQKQRKYEKISWLKSNPTTSGLQN